MKQHKIYSDTIDPKAINQFYEALDCDFAVKGALMPDAHLGYAMPIGGVIATKDTIVPAWVGYDIGCGMCAMKTNAHIDDVKANSEDIFKDIYKHIPVGFNHHKNPSVWDIKDTILCTNDLTKIFLSKNGFNQLGTLGSGNHFIEIGSDKDEAVWIIIHSGSRGVGHGVAVHYMNLAWGGQGKKEWHRPLDVNSQDGKDYIMDMNFCLEFALENRKQMIQIVSDILSTYCKFASTKDIFINRNHNHAELKDGLWIHRKGATHAENKMMGVIPGNMRDGSFIVEGKGNPDSLYSSSHGAGRVSSRKQAKATIKFEYFQDQMQGITAKVEKSTIDESPDAYKDIFQVMEEQKDLVKVIAHIKPIINIKG